MKYYLFMDPEVDMVASLRKTLILMGRTDLRVATQRLTEEQGRNLVTEVIVRFDGDLTYNTILSENDFTIYVFTNGPIENEVDMEVNSVKELVKAALKIVPTQSSEIKFTTNIKSSNLEDQGNTQVKSITFTATSCGKEHII